MTSYARTLSSIKSNRRSKPTLDVKGMLHRRNYFFAAQKLLPLKRYSVFLISFEAERRC
jgi:hypothetical protein